MIELRDIIIGAILGILVIGGIYAGLYGPDYIREISYPPKQKVKFIAVGGYAFKDWALRLDEENSALPHQGYLKSPLLNAPFTLKDMKIATADGITRIYGQFESEQDATTLYGKFEGQIAENEKQPARIKIDILSAKHSIDGFNLNRASGQLSLTEHARSAEIEGTLQIGSMNYGGIPFGGTQIRLKGDTKSIAADMTSHISGHQGTIFKTLGNFEQGALVGLDGTLTIDSFLDLAQTVQTMSMGGDTPLPAEFFNKFPTIDIKLLEDRTPKDPATRQFNLSIPSLGKSFKGLLAINPQDKTLKIGAQFLNIWPGSYPFGLEKVSGDVISQGIIELSFNQQDDDTFGPFGTKIKNLTLQKGDLQIQDINGTIKYRSLAPIELKKSPLKAAQISSFAPPFKDIQITLDSVDNVLLFDDISAMWGETLVKLNFNINKSQQLPDITLKNTHKDISEIRDVTGFDISFSAPIELSHEWVFEENNYQSRPPKIKNTEAGILTLNSALPELSNFYTESLHILLDDPDAATLKATGRNPILYGSNPVSINTKIDRRLAD